MASLSSRPGQDRAFVILVAASVALHLSVALVAAAVMLFSRAEPPPPPEAIKTRLVKLGKKRDEKLLPRIDKSPKPPKKNDAKKPPEVEKPLPEQPKKESEKPVPAAPKTDEPPPSAKDLLDKMAEPTKRDLSDLISDKIEPDEGHEEGSKLGTEVIGRMKVTYNDKILARIKENLSVPKTVSEQERLFLKARVKIAIGGDGRLLTNRLVQKSTNAGFDNAVLAAVQKSAPFPAPPVVAQAFYKGGVSVNVCPLSCR